MKERELFCFLYKLHECNFNLLRNKNENPLVHDLSQAINFGHCDELISKKRDAKEDELFPVVY